MRKIFSLFLSFSLGLYCSFSSKGFFSWQCFYERGDDKEMLELKEELITLDKNYKTNFFKIYVFFSAFLTKAMAYDWEKSFGFTPLEPLKKEGFTENNPLYLEEFETTFLPSYIERQKQEYKKDYKNMPYSQKIFQESYIPEIKDKNYRLEVLKNWLLTKKITKENIDIVALYMTYVYEKRQKDLMEESHGASVEEGLNLLSFVSFGAYIYEPKGSDRHNFKNKEGFSISSIAFSDFFGPRSLFAYSASYKSIKNYNDLIPGFYYEEYPQYLCLLLTSLYCPPCKKVKEKILEWNSNNIMMANNHFAYLLVNVDQSLPFKKPVGYFSSPKEESYYFLQKSPYYLLGKSEPFDKTKNYEKEDPLMLEDEYGQPMPHGPAGSFKEFFRIFPYVYRTIPDLSSFEKPFLVRSMPNKYDIYGVLRILLSQEKYKSIFFDESIGASEDMLQGVPVLVVLHRSGKVQKILMGSGDILSFLETIKTLNEELLAQRKKYLQELLVLAKAAIKKSPQSEDFRDEKVKAKVLKSSFLQEIFKKNKITAQDFEQLLYHKIIVDQFSRFYSSPLIRISSLLA